MDNIDTVDLRTNLEKQQLIELWSICRACTDLYFLSFLDLDFDHEPEGNHQATLTTFLQVGRNIHLHGVTAHPIPLAVNSTKTDASEPSKFEDGLKAERWEFSR